MNRPPLAEDDLVATLRDTPARIELTANDRDPDGDDGVPESTTITRPPEHGTVEPLGEGVILYTPAAGYVGADGLGYRLCESGDCAFAQVSVVVEDDAVLQTPAREETSEDVLPLVELPPLGGSPDTNPSYVSPDRAAAQQARCSRSPLAWGGHGNGRIPPDQLAPIGGGHLLETTAAGRFQQLRSAAARGFHPLIAYLDRGDGLGEALAGMLRPGNAGSQHAADHIDVFEAAIDQLGDLPDGVAVVVRADTAGCTHDFLAYLRAAGVGFSVGYALSAAVRTAIRALTTSCMVGETACW